MWIGIGLTLAVLFSALLYRADRSNRHMHPALRVGLGLLRLGVLTLLLVLLWRPAIRTIEQLEEPPVVVVLQDLSASIDAEHESWADSLGALTRGLGALAGGRVDVKVLGFGSELVELQKLDGADVLGGADSAAFNHVTTDLYAGLEGMRSRWGGANLSAVILATDGRVNRGRDPEAWGAGLGAPLLAIALGNPEEKEGLRIDALLHNDVAGLGNKYPVEILIGANRLNGQSGTLTLSGSGLPSQRVEFTCPEAGTIPPFRLMVEGVKPGLQKININVTVGEMSRTRSAYIEIIENRKRVLLTARAPHPDRGAVARALAGAEHYEIVQLGSEDLTALNPADFDAVFFIGPESGDTEAADFLKGCLERHVAVGILGGPATDWNLLSSMGIGMELQGVTGRAADKPTDQLTFDPRGAVNPGFPHFALPAELDAILAEVPPTTAPFGEINWGLGHAPLLFQRLGHLATEHPLLTCFHWGESPAALMLGEGFWRWRTVGHLQTGSHEAFDAIWRRVVGYLTSDESVERFRIDAPRMVAEDEPVRLKARVYDATFAPALGADIRLELQDEDGHSFNYNFSAASTGASTGYLLDMGRLPRGAYTWRAESPGHVSKTGGFQVTPIEVEASGSPADHAMLARLTAARGGALFSPDQRVALLAHIAALPTLTPMITPIEHTSDLIEKKWLLALLLVLLTLEWSIRRYTGAY
ncbi:MAG: hypothetical protein P8M07_06745 [Flavobacteriales bacterium]|nr:hypothetical protein [Flavobacteriales bacterium]